MGSLRELWLELENENINFPLISTKQASLSLDELINLVKEKLEPLDASEMERLILQTEILKKE